MFFLDLTLKSCILWIFFSLFFLLLICLLSLCIFIANSFVCVAWLSFFCWHCAPTKPQTSNNNNNNIQSRSFGKNHKSFQIHRKFPCWSSCAHALHSTLIFFCSFFRHYHEPLEIRNLFIFHPNEQFWDFFLCFSHTPFASSVCWLCMKLSHFYLEEHSALKGGSISCCGEKKIPFCRYSLNVSCRSCVSTFTTLLFSIWSAEGGREVEWHDLITIFLICRSADHHRSSSGSQVNETTSDEVNLSSPETSIFCCSHPPPSPFGDPVSSSCRWNVKSYRHDESSHDWHR